MQKKYAARPSTLPTTDSPQVNPEQRDPTVELQALSGNDALREYIAAGVLTPERADRAPEDLRTTAFTAGTHADDRERTVDEWARDIAPTPDQLPDDPMSIVAERDPDWGLFVQALTHVPEAKRQACILSIRGQRRWDEMLAAMGPEHLPLVRSWLDADQDMDSSVDDRVEGAANSARARVALTAIDALAKDDVEGRLEGRVRELLALGVALPRSTRSPLGSEGVLSIDSAEQAAQALLAMPVQEYLRVAMLLEVSGDESRLQQSFLLLDAVAARAKSGAFGDLEGFSDAIRGMDDAKLHDATTVQQTSTRDKTAMEHKFKRGSGVAALQVAAAEADPILALQMTQHDELDKDATEGHSAAQQEAAIERHTRSEAVARKVGDARDYVLRSLRSVGCRPHEVAAVNGYLGGGAYDEASWQTAVKKLERGMGRSFPGEQTLRLVRESAGAGVRKGLDAEQVAQESAAITGQDATADVDQGLVDSFDEAGREFTQENLQEWRPRVESMLTEARGKVFRGQDVVFEVRWEYGGTHYMTFTDVDERGGQFMVHNTSNGQTAWVSRSDIVSGRWSRVGRGTGLMTALIS